MSKKEVTNDSEGGDFHNKTSPKRDAVTLPTRDFLHLADLDCWRVVCSSTWASSIVKFIFDSCMCSSSDLMLNTHGAFLITASGSKGND